ncbi:MAG: GNAT family N-acetyltransferase [Moorea sp. SIO2B7]|nr:GNAT family N-acetyltransferase [Moorena sp. SIO2B7]
MLPEGYQLRVGSVKDQALLVKFMNITYQERFQKQQDFSHLADTVQKYITPDTPLWFVEPKIAQNQIVKPIACLWMGNAIDQVQGDRYSYIFLLHVLKEHRRKGIGSALMRYAQDWAKKRGDRQIGIQVFANNQPALNLYHCLGYQTQSLLMLKPLLEQ